mmetsp:Transcript_26755/g.25784  ORF Transcript_26755/g.25784 Transcript_26755/m.25784 type:complete len:142 (+) Transcript_26755:622-1047(+)
MKDMQVRRELEERERFLREEEQQRKKNEEEGERERELLENYAENLEKNLQSDEEEDNGEGVDLEKDSRLANYFQEIVKNANKNGEEIDLSKYKHLLSEYDSMYQQRQGKKEAMAELENEAGFKFQTKRKKYNVEVKPERRN